MQEKFRFLLMLLTLDLGNSAIKGAWIDAHFVAHAPFRIETSRFDWPKSLREHLMAGPECRRAGIASVVPLFDQRAMQAVEEGCGMVPTLIRPALSEHLKMGYATPLTLGADRYCAALALAGRFGPDRATVGVLGGTATTLEVVSQGTYLGGAILPSPGLAMHALATGTAQLIQVPLERPSSPIGSSTMEALQSGLMEGYLASIAGLLARISKSLNQTPTVICSGGWGGFLHEHLGIDTELDPHLVLKGVAIALQES